MTSEAAPAGATRMAPIVTPDTKFFWEAADRGQFVGQKCGECGKYTFPPRPMCPRCRSTEWRALKLSGRGTVYSWVVPRHPVLPIFETDLVVALVELEEGIRIVSNVYDVPLAEMRNGLAVEVFFAPTAKGGAVAMFRPRGAGQGA